MKKNEIIKDVGDGLSAASNLLELISPIFAGVPLFIFVVSKVIGLVYPNYIIKRIKKFEFKLNQKKIAPDKFINKINNLSEHNRYVFANNLTRIITECIPETVDVYISVLIDMIMKNSVNSPYETLCEIISQLNRNDLITLQMINEYIEEGSRDYYNKMMLEYKYSQEKKCKYASEAGDRKIIGTNYPPFFTDRNIIFENKTVFCKDFTTTFKLDTPEMGFPLLYETVDENDNASMKWAYIIRSLIKLENLGIINIDIIMTLGTSSNLNMDRFHITLFGDQLLVYIKESKTLIKNPN